jgi:hypothetical protein
MAEEGVLAARVGGLQESERGRGRAMRAVER